MAAPRQPGRCIAVIGGGILGLSTALALTQRHRGATVSVLEKERAWAVHQSGHNSGVIHSGVYYRPGSLKARLCRAGNASMVQFCRENGIRHEVCGKLIVAVDEAERPGLEALHQRALDNGLAVKRLGPEAMRELEPHVTGVGAIRLPSTAVVDFREVCQVMARLLADLGADLRLDAEVRGVRSDHGRHVLDTTAGEVEADAIVTCGGLQSDRLAATFGATPSARIIPFRGEYYELKPSRADLVRGLVYPVPDPSFPFLGPHFTRGIDGTVHVGPNAVVALSREGYRRTEVDLADAAEVLLYPGFWRLAVGNARAGIRELVRSCSKAAFVRSLARLVPELTADDLTPAGAGVRAQAVLRDGTLVDDFLIVGDSTRVHVCNAPSPAATASLEIGRLIAERVATAA